MPAERAITELSEHLAEVLAAVDVKIGPQLIAQAIERASGWHVETKEVNLNRLDDPEYKPGIQTTLTIRRDLTEEEKAEREARAERRRQVAIWEDDPAAGPPPEGVGFLELLEQDVWWKPRSEPPIRIEDMSPSHRRRLLAYLERNADRMKFGEETYLLLSVPHDISDTAGDMLNQEISTMAHTPAIEWLAEKPLVARLREMVARDDKPLRKLARKLAGTDDRRK